MRAASLKLTCARELAVLTHDRRGEQILVIPVRPPSAGGHGRRGGARAAVASLSERGAIRTQARAARARAGPRASGLARELLL